MSRASFAANAACLLSPHKRYTELESGLTLAFIGRIPQHCFPVIHGRSQVDATMSWKENNKTYQILKAAEEGGYGVVAAIA